MRVEGSTWRFNRLDKQVLCRLASTLTVAILLISIPMIYLPSPQTLNPKP